MRLGGVSGRLRQGAADQLPCPPCAPSAIGRFDKDGDGEAELCAEAARDLLARKEQTRVPWPCCGLKTLLAASWQRGRGLKTTPARAPRWFGCELALCRAPRRVRRHHHHQGAGHCHAVAGAEPN